MSPEDQIQVFRVGATGLLAEPSHGPTVPFLRLKKKKNFSCLLLHVCVLIHVCLQRPEGLDLELQAIMSH